MTMNEVTLQRRTQQLIKELTNHTHQEEILQLMQEQLDADTVVIPTFEA